MMDAGIDDITYSVTNNLIGQWAQTSNGQDMRSLSIQKAVEEELGSPLSAWQRQDHDALQRQYDEKYIPWKIAQDNFDEASRFAETYSAENPYVEGEDKYEYRKRSYKAWEDHVKANNIPAMEEIEDLAGNKTKAIMSLRYILNVSAEPDIPEAYKPLADRKTERAYVRAVYNRTQKWLSDRGYGPDDMITVFRGVGKSAGDVSAKDIGTKIRYRGNAAESWSLSSKVSTQFGTFQLSMKVPVRNILSTSRTGPGCLIEGEVILMGNQDVEALVVAAEWDL
jgi:hypothetical protein